MQLHIVGGFLGSGKTTAIIGAAKALMARGERVGVVTNDQGRYLVDTAFFQAASVPAVEVTGGCFCCNYSDLEAQLAQLKETARPDVIFAESVGSCTDIVATVVKPLQTLNSAEVGEPASFSVFADARLLRRRLLDLPMPFSDDVVYLFDQQIDEAGALVVNKRDLLSPEQLAETVSLVGARYPGRHVRLQNSLLDDEVAGWLADLESGIAAPPAEALDIDYDRYGAGEAELAWLDQRLSFTVPAGQGRAVVLAFLTEVRTALEHRGAAIGHLKVMVSAGDSQTKVSFPTLATEGWHDAVPSLPGTEVELLLNARVQMDAEALRNLVAVAVAGAGSDDVTVVGADLAYFHPKFPNPTHRLQ